MSTLTKTEAAERLGISIKTLGRLMKRGEIAFYRMTSRPTFGEHHLVEFEQSHEVKATWKPLRRRR